MEISEVRVKLVNNLKERLKAFCSMTLENDFVIRDLKVIDGANGIFVAMPSRKLADRCPGCGCKNHLRARFCNDCGEPLGENRSKRAAKRGKLHADIAHPINALCRERIQNIVIDAYQSEVEKSKQPGYKPVDMEVDLDAFEEPIGEGEPVAAAAPAAESQNDAPGSRKPTRQEPTEAGGYDDLIAELKRDAAARRETREPAVSKDRYADRPDDRPNIGPAEQEQRAPAPAKAAVQTPQEEPADEFGAGIL